MNNQYITHQVVYNTKDKYIAFKSFNKSHSFILIQVENGLTFRVPVFNLEDSQVNDLRSSIIEYIINNDIANYISFEIDREITLYHFQLHPHHLFPIM